MFRCTTNRTLEDLIFADHDGLVPTPSSGPNILFNFSNVAPENNGLMFTCRDSDGTETITLNVLCKKVILWYWLSLLYSIHCSYYISSSRSELHHGNIFSIFW